MRNNLILSTLGHTWILDLDGTILKHNGYKAEGKDTFLEGSLAFLHSIPDKDLVIFITSRSEDVKEITENLLKQNSVRFDHIIYNAPYGERILINDDKPSGLNMSYGIAIGRDRPWDVSYSEDESL